MSRLPVFAWISALIIHLFLIGSAYAANITQFSPQGEVASIRQVRASFSEPIVSFGDPKTPAPFTIQCAEAGSGRWVDGKSWVYDFVSDLPPGTRCTFTLKANLKTLAGNAITGTTRFNFSTGGPAVVNEHPNRGARIDENQIFVLTLNGRADETSIVKHAYCEAESINERIPLQLVKGKARDELIKHFHLEQEVARTVMLQCRRQLPSGAKVDIVWGQGIATPNGVAVSQDQRLDFTVRPAFSANFTCQRENAQAPCTPIQSLTLEFSAPVPRNLAEKIRLKMPGGTSKPYWKKDRTEETVESVTFRPPFPEQANIKIELPGGFVDEYGRTLSNANAFPLATRTGEYPPLAKFPAEFGILELNAEPTLPITVRNIEANLTLSALQPQDIARVGDISQLRVQRDADIIGWIRKLNSFGNDFEEHISKNGKKRQARELSMLKNEPSAEHKTLPKPNGSREFEVIGLPLPKPGFYVLELSSKKLGAALLGKNVPMYVRSSVLVTNLAVHFKQGQENAVVWVTALDTGKPVPNAEVRVSDCNAKPLWQGRTDRNGLAMIQQPIKNEMCVSGSLPGMFVSARLGNDFSFVLSSWNNGIEAWRFNVPTASGSDMLRAHTVFDRTLLRAGETLSMKHYLRQETMHGFNNVPAAKLPKFVSIRHNGSNGEVLHVPLTWRKNGTADSTFKIPADAKLGEYSVSLNKNARAAAAPDEAVEADGEDVSSADESVSSGSFRVAEFRLPLMTGRITPPKAPLVAAASVPLNVQLGYINGGAAAGQALKITSVLRPRSPDYPGYDDYSFTPYRESQRDRQAEKIVADKIPLQLDKQGAGQITIKDLPKITEPQQLATEATYFDPNGEVQTLSSSTPLWASGIVLGIHTDDWVSVGKRVNVKVAALDVFGRPYAKVSVKVRAVSHTTSSHRKRIVGGFYAYENESENKDLGTVCSGTTDARGLMLCDAKLSESGNVILIAEARDNKNNPVDASTSVWVTGSGQIWFDGENLDRIDVLPEKKHYNPGEVARFQVRMPFRRATALVAVEREGIIDTKVVEISGKDPTVEVPIKASYGPNVYISVLAVRGRLRETPWYSFFTWGWKAPVEWFHTWREYEAPGVTVDLSKPAFKYGLGEVQVGTSAHKLQVSVTPASTTYQTRTTAQVTVQVKLPNGKPAPQGSEVAIAVVDQALLELQPNESWDLLKAMLQRRSYGVETATAQMQVVGKRHFGRKAVPAGGGGGHGASRELFDTLLLWNPRVLLDAQGRATINIPLNDSLTSFRIAVIADAGSNLFGSGEASIRTTQDLQIISGLPPLVREGDQYRASFTLRNSSNHAMTTHVTALEPSIGKLPEQDVTLPAGQAREVAWLITTPANATAIDWEVIAREKNGAAKDGLKFTQQVVAAVPITVQQATLMQVEKETQLKVARPADALPGRGGVALTLQPKLAGSVEGLRRYFENYPFSCLEQQTSIAIGLRDTKRWQTTMDAMPRYMDDDGLARYFPGDGPGSDVLTAYLLSISHEGGLNIPDNTLEKLQNGLIAFVEGRITRAFWSPKKDLDMRKLAAIEALSRYGKAQPRMLDSIQINPNLWPTSAVIDWLSILQRMPELPQRAKRMTDADQILRARLNYQGTRMGFSTETDDYWWWLMASGDLNALKLLLVVSEQPAWRDDVPRLMIGTLQRQQRGHWGTTTANAWGRLTLEKFSRLFENQPVNGVTRATLENTTPQIHSWAAQPNGGKLQLPWPAQGAGTLTVTHEGSGKPWLTLQSLAAVQLKQPFSSGYRIIKTITPLEQQKSGVWKRGDTLRIKLDIDAQTDMTWVALNDPIPAGASILGSGLGRDSQLATAGERAEGSAELAYQERRFDSFRAFYNYVPKGKWSIEYTVRLNNAGNFQLPPTRVEAMYAPEMFGEIPNAAIAVQP